MVSLGCPKALVDSERILTGLRSAGYRLAAGYEGADVVVVNTCGFLDSAKAESLEAIGEAMGANGRVIVTGCMGHEAESIRERFPGVLAITGPQATAEVMAAVHAAAPIIADALVDLVPAHGLKLTPRHYSYLKISEGCTYLCTFCIIPSIRGDLVSRRPDAILREAEKLVQAGTRELLVIAQDTSAYGLDLGHASFGGGARGPLRAHIVDLARALGELGAWVRLHYIYPYPHVDMLIPLMAEGLVLPYLDIPFQHASPAILSAMRRPANATRVLDRIAAWRRAVPDLVIRSTFIAGFPGETEADFQYLLDWIEEAQIDRAGCFAYEPVAGAAANALAGALPEAVRTERRDRFMAAAARISSARLQRMIGRTIDAIIDEVDAAGGATFRSKGDAPEIDGQVLLRDAAGVRPGDIVAVRIEDADAFDLYGVPAGASGAVQK
jgi:ribosomal protein S12 methylthiotransferase